MNTTSLFRKKSFLNIQGALFEINKPMIMGILNITADSFFDGGEYTNEKAQLLRVEKMINEGADFIDIGAQSTRPGAKEIDAKSEISKLNPLVSSIRKKFPDTIISIDTWHSEVAKATFESGADIINDISGGQFDSKMFETIAEIQIPYILMHTAGKPNTMQDNPQYDNVLKEVIYFMSQQINKLNHLGVNDIIIDPGFGFGKTLEHNYQLLNKLNHFAFLEVPILVGISRKSMVYKTISSTANDALNGTTALHMAALNQGSDILRVHDVKEARECICLFENIQKSNK